jgi:carboxypeptidase Taq
MSEAAAASSAYEALEERYARYSNLGSVSRLLNWDQQVMMPDAGTPARSAQLSTMSAVSHDVITDDETERLLDAVNEAELTAEQAAVVREIRAEYERADAVPSSLIEEIAQTASEAQPVWQAAKGDDDFDHFAPMLDRLRELQVERAREIDPDRSPYDVMFEDSERYLPLSKVERIFDQLIDALVPLIEDSRPRAGRWPIRSTATIQKTTRWRSPAPPWTRLATTGTGAGWTPPRTRSCQETSSTPGSRPGSTSPIPSTR